MNVLEHYVTKVLSEPYEVNYQDRTWFEVMVECSCYGDKREEKLVFRTKEEAEKVNVGYMYMA